MLRFRFFCLLLSLFFTSCSAIGFKGEGQKKLGADANYFIGLQLLKSGNENLASQKFNACAKKGTYYCSQESLRELCKIGSVQEKNAACLNLVKKFPTDDNILIASRQLFSAGEISKLIEITKNCSITEAPNEVIKLRLEAMRKRGDSNYLQEVFTWFTTRQLSTFHNDFYKACISENVHLQKEIEALLNTEKSDSLDSENQDSLLSDFLQNAADAPEHNLSTAQISALYLRILVFRRNYVQALLLTPQIFANFENDSLPVLPQICSDLGKTFLYGEQSLRDSADTFKKLAQKYQNTDGEYYFWFYAGRCYDKLKNYRANTNQSYKNAIKTAKTDSQKDNAIWYLLDSSLHDSTETIIAILKEYAPLWANSAYFDDFFESLAPILLASGNFDAFGKVYKIIDGYASDEVTGHFAYIYARLCQEKLSEGSEEEINHAFERALRSGTSYYYGLLAGAKLDISVNQLSPVIFNASRSKNQKQDPELAKSAENLLEGYATFGFPQLIYPNFIELYTKGLSADKVFFLCDFLSNCGSENNDYYVHAIRMANRYAPFSDRPLTKHDFQYLFPKGFEKYVEEAALDYNISPSVLYGLIRSESFFKSDIHSHAGAIGLTQLMPTTGSDIARRFKISEYDLKNPETNINFGTYYFSELIRRCNNDYLSGVFSYNAGITRVRKWLKGTFIGFNSKEQMPHDLFLETIPYPETREYGRKVVSASLMYDLIYNGNMHSYARFF